MAQTITIGTRGSKLALWQAEHVRSLITAAHPDCDVVIQVIKTRGDKILDTALNLMGGKGVFTKELEVELEAGTVDMCVHSMKDVPMELPEGLVLHAMTQRADTRDALIAFNGLTFDTLPAGARLATGSLRRAAQIRALRHDLELYNVRGNVDTRINKVRSGEFDAMVLASAGVNRLGLGEAIVEYFDPSVLIPAVGQGAVGIEVRSDDETTRALLDTIADADTMRDVSAERVIMTELNGGCQVPLGAYGRMEDGSFVLDAFVATLDGSTVVRSHVSGNPVDAIDLAYTAVDELKAQGAEKILEALR